MLRSVVVRRHRGRYRVAADLQHRPHDPGRAGYLNSASAPSLWRCSASSSSWARSWPSSVIYFKKLWPFCADNGRDSGLARHVRWPVVRLWCKIIVACLPGRQCWAWLLDDWLDAHLYNSVAVALMLIVYGIAFILIERRPRVPTTTKLSRITYRQALHRRCLAGAGSHPRHVPQRLHHHRRPALRHEPRLLRPSSPSSWPFPVMAGAYRASSSSSSWRAAASLRLAEISARCWSAALWHFVVSIAGHPLPDELRQGSTPSPPSAGTASPWASSSWVSGPCRHSCWRNIVNKKAAVSRHGRTAAFWFGGCKASLVKGRCGQRRRRDSVGLYGGCLPGQAGRAPPACFAATSPPCGEACFGRLRRPRKAPLTGELAEPARPEGLWHCTGAADASGNAQAGHARPLPRCEVYEFFGNVTRMVVPVPTWLCRSIFASCSRAMCLTMASPKPVPPVALERLLSTR